MSRISGFVWGAVLIGAASPLYAATVIDFDDGQDQTSVGDHYAPVGVRFENAQWDDFVSPGEDLVGAGGLKLIGDFNSFRPSVSSPIVAIFAEPVSMVEVRGLNVGVGGARIDAFDAPIGGNAIAADEAFGVGLGPANHPLLQVESAEGIWRVHFYQPDYTIEPNDGILFDNLTFVSVPEPAAGVLVVVGAMFALRRR